METPILLCGSASTRSRITGRELCALPSAPTLLRPSPTAVSGGVFCPDCTKRPRRDQSGAASRRRPSATGCPSVRRDPNCSNTIRVSALFPSADAGFKRTSTPRGSTLPRFSTGSTNAVVRLTVQSINRSIGIASMANAPAVFRSTSRTRSELATKTAGPILLNG